MNEIFFFKVGTSESALQRIYHHKTMRAVIWYSKLSFFSFNSTYCVSQHLSACWGKQSPVFKLHLSQCCGARIFLKQINNFTSPWTKSEWLITVAYQLLKNINSRYGQPLCGVSVENIMLHKAQYQFDEVVYTALHPCWTDAPTWHREALLLTAMYFKRYFKTDFIIPSGLPDTLCLVY